MKMAAGKSKYQVSVTKMHKLPPIREETMSLRTPRSGRRQRSYTDDFVSDRKISVQPLNPRPSIHTRPLPSDRSKKVTFKPQGPVRSETEILDSYPKVVYKEEPKEQSLALSKSPPTPNPKGTLVDGLVADYLHYAQYGHIIPVYEGSGSLTCSCCTERNRESVRTMLGFPADSTKNQNSRAPTKIVGPNPKPDTWLTGYANKSAPKSPNKSPRFDELLYEPSPRSEQRGDKWMDFQPKPYATSYANAEFNRPLLVYNHLRESNDNSRSVVSNEILDANTRYNDAMKRLQKYAFS